MIDVFQRILTLFIAVPYVLTAAVFAVSRLTGRTPVKSFRIAADCTVPFLILAARVMMNGMIPKAGAVLLIGILAAGISCAVAERLRSKEFRTRLMLRNLWRMLFIGFSLIYILLVLAGLVMGVVSFTSG
ncbi:hypothetical protein NCCP2716_02050 [Sporosarcina sp. NCCP-2716]|uniref:DUF3397 family protein n=1 Tax=Sporosarcina sp. NCCP-2716 TaxID=2943679 RepID=UPI00204027FD|nr:DUF3397 family protein [Sporosarcina sp. NCCP-2716]GKV67707.1 hypothetical protein NCCP2716_02050 [Sporosarcina sp. NCCP-2716]